MKKYKSVRQSFGDCPFTIILPKITIAEPFISIEFFVSFIGKPHPIKYVFSECTITDKLGNKAVVKPDGQSNFLGNKKHNAVIEEKRLLKSSFTLVISILKIDGERVDVTYQYEKNKPIILKSVAISDMTDEEKHLFMSMFNIADKQKKEKEKEKVGKKEKLNFNEYVDAVSSEMYFLKNNGGKKYKVTDGRLLTPNANEFCYSFELESELYLSDDAPVSVIKGLETVSGTVVVCDGFQIILSLEQNIGDTVSSAQINVEPWKLLEKLKDRIKMITPADRIAWKLFHNGPYSAEKTSDISTIKRGQEMAVTHALSEEITVIWGPPGTGKTYTMAQMTERFVSMGKTVLIVSHSNISVDNVVKQISNQFSKNHLSPILSQGKVLRYGYVRDEELSKNDNCVAFNFALNKHPELKKQYSVLSEESRKLKIELQFKHDTAKAKKRKELEERLKSIRARLKTESQILTANAQVVATTVSKIYMDKLFDNKKYDVVMFDEVSMAYVPQLLCAAAFAKEKFICVGDFRQLAPIVQSEKAKNVLQSDIFSFLNICKYSEIHNHPWLVMLNEQRRMHPHISKFSNQHIYKGLLKDHSSVLSKWNSVTAREPLSDKAMNLIDLAGTFCAASKNADNSRFNFLSAVLSFAVALKSEEAQKGLQFKEEERVGIITPYAAQTRLIRALIQDYRQKDATAVSCATVHQFQGSERNVVIFDAVESYPFVKPGWLVAKNENGSVMRLINVALTRARCKFITLANTRFWYNKFHETQNTYFKLLEHIKTNDTVVSMKENSLIELIQELDFGKNIKTFYTADDACELLLKDIKSAKKQIFITLPTDKLHPEYESAIADALKSQSRSGVAVTGKAKEIIGLNETWKNLLFKSKDASFPLIVIDDRITWYGFPLSELFFADKNYKFYSPKSPIFRIIGKHTNEMIHSLCDLEYRVDDNGMRIRLSEKANSSAGKGLTEFINNTEACKKCGAPMNLYKGHSGKYSLRCSSCGSFDLLSVHTMNKYLDKVNAKCSVCGKDIYAGVGKLFGIYVKCNNGHFTKLSEL
ncbi:AAA domain-containing protein [Ruminococcus sp.]|uniref:AAA domain-containing protein n=1 Tax=Ruminococcus sp. TaxID=41978 RepID=UPI003F01529C